MQMQRVMMRLMGWVAAVALVLVFGGRAAAAPNDIIQGHVVSLGIGGSNGEGGIYRAGSWVPVRVRLENRSGKQFVGRLGVEQMDLDGDKVLSVGQQVILDPTNVEGRDFWFYYWPRPDDDLHGATSLVVLDESGTQVVSTIPVPTDKNGEGEAVGLFKRDDTNDRSYRWVVILGPRPVGFASYLDSYGGTESVRFSWVERAENMPDNVLGLDGVDTIVWEADKIRPSDLSADFQLNAILEWVKAGGHLIVSVSSQGQEFLKSGSRLRDAMPITFTGLREIKLDDLRRFAGCSELSGDDGLLTQGTGKLRADARPIDGGAVEPFQENPLAVTGIYGQGAVTVLTIDASNPAMEQRISDHNWMDFWNQVAGWQGHQRQLMTRAEYDEAKKQQGPSGADPVSLPPAELHVGDVIPQLVDVTEVTQVRVLVAVLFLLLYWLLAGPVGHLILKMYKAVHWSWWVFGGTVLVATGIAGAVVFFLQLTNYDLRHRTIVLGTVNSNEATVVGYYGVFAPKSGIMAVSQPASPGGFGLNYLAPMCMPTVEPVKPFADPQSYALFDEKANVAAPVFRNTLKKMEGRWTGAREGIEGNYQYSGDNAHPLRGKLTNHSGYDLGNVQFLIHRPATSAYSLGTSLMYRVADWKKGETIDLEKALALETVGPNEVPVYLEQMLQALGHKYADSNGFGSHLTGTGNGLTDQEKALVKDRPDDLLYLLLDARAPDPLQSFGEPRVEPVRPFARAADCTKAFYAAGAMIVARAGNFGERGRAGKDYVASPVPLTINGHAVAGEGGVLFAWALPLHERVSTAPLQLIPNLGPQMGPQPAARTRGNTGKTPEEGQ